MDSFHEPYSARRINLNVIYLGQKTLLCMNIICSVKGFTYQPDMYFGWFQIQCYKEELTKSHRLK